MYFFPCLVVNLLQDAKLRVSDGVYAGALPAADHCGGRSWILGETEAASHSHHSLASCTVVPCNTEIQSGKVCKTAHFTHISVIKHFHQGPERCWHETCTAS